HTHLIVRGRRADGRALVLPRDFVKHGLREIAREVATNRLGLRGPDEERRALLREARAQRLTRLDNVLAREIDEQGRLFPARLGRNRDPSRAMALKARSRELLRLGLAEEIGRSALRLNPDWRERLSAMELHLDIRKRILALRVPERTMRDPTKPWR